MPDPRICCAAGVCCNDPVKQASALATLLEERGVISPDFVAGAMLEMFDLLPKGVGQAVVEGLRPHFAAAAARDQKV